MDWLTEDWAKATYKAAEAALDEALAPAVRNAIDPDAFVADFIARAAVRKVVEWMNSNGYVVIERAELNAAIEQALKVAAEGK